VMSDIMLQLSRSGRQRRRRQQVAIERVQDNFG
jgi:hypothetical protein